MAAVADAVKMLTGRYRSTVLKYREDTEKELPNTTAKRDAGDGRFALAYHTLIHSPALDSMMRIEAQYALNVAQLIEQRDVELAALEARQKSELDEMTSSIGVRFQVEQVNELILRHTDAAEQLKSKWTREIRALKTAQRAEYREMIIAMHRDAQTSPEFYEELIRNQMQPTTFLTGISDESEQNAAKADQKPLNTPPSKSRLRDTFAFARFTKKQTPKSQTASWNQDDTNGKQAATMISQPMEQETRFEESFTVFLGTQFKTMHNLRLVRADVLDLCKPKTDPRRTRKGDVRESVGDCLVDPQRLQTAMSLYSNALCALVVFVDSRFTHYTGVKHEIEKICEQSTDFHFDDFETQFSRLQRIYTAATRGDEEASGATASTRLRTGDVLLTRHSNLSEVHCIFHIVSDETVRDTQLSSRHPVVLALRNVLRLAFAYDVRTLSVPLFLENDCDESMTIGWCVKRAELVFKCVKGFIMECTQWNNVDRTQSVTLQFVVPTRTEPDLLTHLSGLLENIFRMSNPVKG